MLLTAPDSVKIFIMFLLLQSLVLLPVLWGVYPQALDENLSGIDFELRAARAGQISFNAGTHNSGCGFDHE